MKSNELQKVIEMQLQTIIDSGNRRAINDLSRFAKDVITLKQENNLTNEEIVMVLRNGRLGRYGNFYNLDSITVLSWIRLFIKSKLNDQRMTTNDYNKLYE